MSALNVTTYIIYIVIYRDIHLNDKFTVRRHMFVPAPVLIQLTHCVTINVHLVVWPLRVCLYLRLIIKYVYGRGGELQH
jgi:hypothetical protein